MVEPLREVRIAQDCVLVLSKGSVLDFKGDAFINAANEGCVGGFGLDEQVNLSGGFQLKEARKQVCRTLDPVYVLRYYRVMLLLHV